MIEAGRVIGAPVTAGSFENVKRLIVETASRAEGGYVCVANVHMVTTARSDADLLGAMENASVVTSDGMPLVWALKRKGYVHTEKISGPDLMWPLCEMAATEGLPVYFFGGNAKTLQALKIIFDKSLPALQVVGLESPPMLPKKPVVDSSIVERINASGARVVFVGLGCPKQELWMAAYAPHLSAVLLGVGAAFDFMTGTVRRAPVWMQRCGLEWVFRLAMEPRRLWKRYLVTNTLFCWYMAIEWFRSRFQE